MDEVLEKKIRILMSNAAVDVCSMPYRHVDEDDYEFHGISAMHVSTVTDNPSEWVLNNKQAELLVKLYQQLTKKEQTAMLEIMEGYIQSKYGKDYIATAVLTFVHSDNTETLVDMLISDFNSYNQNEYLFAVAALISAITHKPNLFTESLANKIYDWIDEYYTGKNKLGDDMQVNQILHTHITKRMGTLHDKCNIILTRSFAVQIESAFNPQLNQDEQKVIESIEQIGFPLDLVESLHHIDESVDGANKPMKYRDCMSSIRVFTERLYERIAKELDPDTKVDGKDSDKAAKLFKEHNLISTDMSALIVALRHYLSNDGTHRLKSRKEDARIAKNMTIELSLYLLTRLRELTS